MLTIQEYIRQSLETNLFFLRIVKEHVLFSAAALTLRDAKLVPGLMQIKNQLERLLGEAITYANGIVSPGTMTAGDIITNYTYNAEMITMQFTGIPINANLTLRQIRLLNNPPPVPRPVDEKIISDMNERIIDSVLGVIKSQKDTLNRVLNCRMFTSLYPLIIDHVVREEEYYIDHLRQLQRRESPEEYGGKAAMHETFWNEIMTEHAKFIRGMLDPTEEELIEKANNFADEFEDLTDAARLAVKNLEMLPQVTNKSYTATTELRNFKKEGTQGILECNLRSIILPLLSDHVLREANHYLKHLRMYKQMER